MRIGGEARRFAIMLAALSTLSVTLVACQVSTGGTGASNQTLTFTTPNPSQQSPTPTFPTTTCGAWPSNYTPQALDNITIYALYRAQDASMLGPAKPPSTPLTVTAQVGAPINKTLNGKTDADGLAAIPLSFTDPTPGVPVVVTLYASGWQTCQTFFTPGATYTPTPDPTVPGTVTPSATP